MSKMYRQGDVLLIPIIIEREVKTRKTARLVLAEGEQTGHVHVMEDVTMVEGLFREPVIVVDKPTPLKHVDQADAQADHPALLIEPGTYLVRTQREFEPEVESNQISRARFD